MSIQSCQCLPCYLDRELDPHSTAENNSPTQVLPLEMLEKPLQYLDTNDLLQASFVCKRWRFIAATIYKKAQTALLYSKPCFKSFYDDFYASHHLFIFDVSSSMNSGQRRENARKFYDRVSQFIEPVIKKVGVHICKFAAECLLKYFKSSKKASTFIDQDSKLQDGSNLSVALEAVIDKIALINDPSTNSHVHIISDMVVSFDDAILGRPSLYANDSKITFHYYDASKNPENNFLKRMQTAYQTQMETLEPESKKRYSDSVELNFYRSKKLKE